MWISTNHAISFRDYKIQNTLVSKIVPTEPLCKGRAQQDKLSGNNTMFNIQ